jgi:hypothetical protein
MGLLVIDLMMDMTWAAVGIQNSRHYLLVTWCMLGRCCIVDKANACPDELHLICITSPDHHSFDVSGFKHSSTWYQRHSALVDSCNKRDANPTLVSNSTQ